MREHAEEMTASVEKQREQLRQLEKENADLRLSEKLRPIEDLLAESSGLILAGEILLAKLAPFMSNQRSGPADVGEVLTSIGNGLRQIGRECETRKDQGRQRLEAARKDLQGA